MRFLIHCKNPRTGQTHEFELDARDLRDAEKQVQAAGLVAGRIEPAGDHDATVTPAARPPTTADRETAGNRRRIRPAARLVGAAGFVAILIAALATILPDSEPNFGFQDIKASVRYDGSRFSIANMDDFPWHNVVIDVNGGLANRGYALSPGVIVSRQAIAASNAEFVDDRGRRYDPRKEPLRQLRIHCDIADGKNAFYTRVWDPPLGAVSRAQ